MSDERAQESFAQDGEEGADDPTATDGCEPADGSRGTYATKIPPDHPGLKLERAHPRTLRRGPILVTGGVLSAAVGIAVVVALSPRAVDQAKAAPLPESVSSSRPVQLPDDLQNAPGNDAPLRGAAVPRLGPPVHGRGLTDPGANAGSGSLEGAAIDRRQAIREERQKALASPILAELENPATAEQGATGGAQGTNPGTSQGSGAVAGGARQGPDGSGSSSDPNMQQRKNDFLSHDGKSSAAYLGQSSEGPRSPYEVKTGTIIPTTLITGIDSDLPGQVIGQVRENVYDTVSGRFLLIPQGSRLIASYDSMVGFGQERVLVCWNRLIRPDGVSIALECMPGVDLAGYAGFADDVDHHWWRILSGVALGTLLSATAQRSQGDVTGLQPTVPQLWASNVGGSLNSAGQQLTQKNLQIQPTIKVRPGFTVNVLVSKDIIIAPFARPR